jgi:hypothetical protein
VMSNYDGNVDEQYARSSAPKAFMSQKTATFTCPGDM